MEYKIKDTILEFSCTLGTIRAIEQLKGKSFMSIVSGSYSPTGVCTAKLDDMLDILGLAYAKADKSAKQEDSVKYFKEFIEDSGITYNEVFQLYDKLLISLQYQGKTEEEIEEIILGNLKRVETMKSRMLAKQSAK